MSENKPTSTPLSDAEKAKQFEALNASHKLAAETSTTAPKPISAAPASVATATPSKPADKPATPPATTTATATQNAPTGTASVPRVLPDMTGKPQGGQPTTLNPHTAPVKTGQGGTKGNKRKGAPPSNKVNAAPAEKAKGNGHFDATAHWSKLNSAWPSWAEKYKPTDAAIIMAAATISGANWQHALGTKKCLALAVYCMPTGGGIDVYDVAFCVTEVLYGNHDNNLSNVMRTAAKSGKLLLHTGSAAAQNPERNGMNHKPLVSYHATLFDTDKTGKVTRCIDRKYYNVVHAALAAAGVKAPKYMTLPDTK